MAVHYLRTILGAAIDFVYPRHCQLCGKQTDKQPGQSDSRTGLCESCRQSLIPPRMRSCDRCGAPVGPYLDTDQGCIYCRRDTFAFESVIRLGVYEGPLKFACLRMKNEHGSGLAAACARLMYDESTEAIRSVNADCVVPIPPHWTGRLRRIDNPAETIASRLAARLQVPICRRILRKVRRTPKQTSISAKKRRTNLRNAFRASIPKRIHGGTVLLVDDVLTTGTTAHEAALELKKRGASRVVVAVLARGIGQ